jgi:hypothetical protein
MCHSTRILRECLRVPITIFRDIHSPYFGTKKNVPKIKTEIALKILVVVVLRRLRYRRISVENSPECHRMRHLRLEQPS